MEKYDVIHWCEHWNFAKFNEDFCIKYDKDKTPIQNVNLWKKSYKGISRNLDFSYLFGANENEIIIDFKNKKNKMLSLDDCLYIYTSPKNLDIDKIKELSYKYPQYNWVYENPLKEYTLEKARFLELYNWLEGLISDEVEIVVKSSTYKKYLEN